VSLCVFRALHRQLSIPKANPTENMVFIPLAITIFTDQSKVAVNAKELLLYDSSFFTYVF
jgi:hypothetical protein